MSIYRGNNDNNNISIIKKKLLLGVLQLQDIKHFPEI